VQCGVEQYLTLQAFDLYRNQILAGGDFIDARLVYLANGKEFLATIADNGDGTYGISYHTVFLGEYELRISAASSAYGSTLAAVKRYLKPVPGGPWPVVSLHGPPSAAASTVSGPGVIGASAAAETVEFYVRVRDRYGNACGRYDAPAHSLEAHMLAGWEVPTTVRDHGDGNYTVSYTPGVEDEYQGATVYRVEVTLDGEHVLMSPFMQRVAPAPTDASQCFADGVPRMLTVGETGEFLVQAVDVKGALRTRGLDNFTLNVSGNQTLYGDIKDLRNGTYLVRFRGEELAYYKAVLDIELDGQPIRGSPFSVKVVPAGLFNVGLFGGFKVVDEEVAKAFIVSGSGLERTVAGERAELDIVSKRLNEDTPGEDFCLELRGPAFIEGIVEGPLTSASYKASFVATKAGEYTGVIKLGRQLLPGCPFQLQVTPDVTAPHRCRADGGGLDECHPFEPSFIKVTTHDMHGNQTRNRNDIFRIALKGGGLTGKGKKMRFRKAVLDGTVRSNQAGVFEMSYAVPIAGAYSIDITHATHPDGPWTPIKDSPFSMVAVPKKLTRDTKMAMNRMRSRVGAAEAAAAVANQAAQFSRTLRPEEVAQKHAEEQRAAEEELARRLAAPDSKSTLYSTAPTQRMEEKERVIMGKLSETAAATMVKRDDTMFRFGFWGQGALIRRAEVVDEETTRELDGGDEGEMAAIEAAETWDPESAEADETWAGRDMGKKRSKQGDLLRLVNKTVFENEDALGLSRQSSRTATTVPARSRAAGGILKSAASEREGDGRQPLALPAP